jgi:hypothetical protein
MDQVHYAALLTQSNGTGERCRCVMLNFPVPTIDADDHKLLGAQA